MRIRAGWAAVMTVAPLAACTEPGTLPAPVSRIEIAAGDQQNGVAGYFLAEPLVVRLVDVEGNPVAGATVQWSFQGRLAQLSATTSTTDQAGQASVRFRLGRDDGEYEISAAYSDQPAARFVALARSGEISSGGGPVDHQCARHTDDVVRCWVRPLDNPAEAIALDTDLRFITWAYAGGQWCGSTRTGVIACVRDADMDAGGQFRPDAAAVQVVAQGPVLVRLVGSSPDAEIPATWCGVAENLSVWCWGRNDAGQVGPGGVGELVADPVQVSASLQADQVAVTDGAACALDRQGKAWCWGSHADGVVPGASSSDPVLVNWPGRLVQIAADSYGNVCALDLQQFVRCWGSGRNGGSGRPGREPTSEPTLIVGNDIFTEITAGDDGFVGLTVDRTLVVWGGLIGATPVRPIDSHVFARLYPGGGNGASCLLAYPEGTRCIDRVGLVRALQTPADRPLIYGIPNRGN
ncbi:MAG TPA: Ig-like domain-containing protein [Gemmatimonadales bacterium]|nr:Ig-like domain-containing protein [Gemmatimonadales bacterium]